MSTSENDSSPWFFDLIGMAVGIIIFIAIGALMIVWSNQYDEILKSSSPGSTLYLTLPFFVGLVTFATYLIIKGLYSGVITVITNVSAQQEELV